MKKPPFVSHYLVLRDLLDGVDVRSRNDSIHYLTSRIENIKMDLVNRGILFDEEAVVKTKYSHYKPYRLIQTDQNIKRAEKLLKTFATEKVKQFLSLAEDEVQACRD
jgi:hypothetical protein